MSLSAILAGLCLAVLLYVYLGYPALLGLLGVLRPRPVLRGTEAPDLTVLIPAHNEAGVIERKVRNTLASDYPPERMEILVLCDGCTDGTGDRVRRLSDEQAEDDGEKRASIRALDLPRMGKGRALDAGASAARGSVLVFTDANVALAPHSLRELVASFADPTVGGVCGDKRYANPGAAGTARGEGLYWRYDRWVKRLESRVGSVFAADGSLYAIRGDLYRPIGNPASADDMAISMRVVLQGFRLVYEPRAEAVEAPPEDAEHEFRRKVRVTNHSMRALMDLGPALWNSGFYSLQLLSHKLVRHLSPVLLLGLLVGSAAAAAEGQALMQLLLGGQGAFYGLAATGRALQRSGVGRWTLLAAPYHFVLIQVAALLGIASLARGYRLATWTPRGGLEGG